MSDGYRLFPSWEGYRLPAGAPRPLQATSPPGWDSGLGGDACRPVLHLLIPTTTGPHLHHTATTTCLFWVDGTDTIPPLPLTRWVMGPMEDTTIRGPAWTGGYLF